SFSCEVTTIQCLPRPWTPRLWTIAWRSSIFWTSRATNWPTSSTTKIRLLPDLQLGEIEVLGIAEALEEEPVHDLGQRLVTAPDAAVGGDVEDDGVRG